MYDLNRGVSLNLGIRPASDESLFGQFTAWSPDSQQILDAPFANADAGTETHILGLDGSDTSIDTGGVTLVFFTPWSPDGARFVFVCRSLSDRSLHLCLVDDGGRRSDIENLIDLTDWSDLAQAGGVTVEELVGQSTIFQVGNIAHDAVSHIPFQPLLLNLWSPDGSSLVLPLLNPDSIDSGPPWGIYVVPCDGGAPIKVGDGTFAIWSP